MTSVERTWPLAQTLPYIVSLRWWTVSPQQHKGHKYVQFIKLAKILSVLLFCFISCDLWSHPQSSTCFYPRGHGKTLWVRMWLCMYAYTLKWAYVKLRPDPLIPRSYGLHARISHLINWNDHAFIEHNMCVCVCVSVTWLWLLLLRVVLTGCLFLRCPQMTDGRIICVEDSLRYKKTDKMQEMHTEKYIVVTVQHPWNTLPFKHLGFG